MCMTRIPLRMFALWGRKAENMCKLFLRWAVLSAADVPAAIAVTVSAFYNEALMFFLSMFWNVMSVFIRISAKSQNPLFLIFSCLSLSPCLSVVIYIKHKKVPMSCETAQPPSKLNPSFTVMPENTLHTHRCSQHEPSCTFFFFFTTYMNVRAIKMSRT